MYGALNNCAVSVRQYIEIASEGESRTLYYKMGTLKDKSKTEYTVFI